MYGWGCMTTEIHSVQVLNKKVFNSVNAEKLQKEVKSDYGKIQRNERKQIYRNQIS